MSRFYIDEAIRKRKCERCGEDIHQGELHLKFMTGTGQYSVLSNLCYRCMKDMLTHIEDNQVNSMLR